MTTEEREGLVQHRYLHFNMRLRGRWDVEVNRKQYDRFCDLLTTGRVPEERQTRRGHGVYQLGVRGKTVPVVYNPHERLIVTALPVDAKWDDEEQANGHD